MRRGWVLTDATGTRYLTSRLGTYYENATTPKFISSPQPQARKAVDLDSSLSIASPDLLGLWGERQKRTGTWFPCVSGWDRKLAAGRI